MDNNEKSDLGGLVEAIPFEVSEFCEADHCGKKARFLLKNACCSYETVHCTSHATQLVLQLIVMVSTHGGIDCVVCGQEDVDPPDLTDLKEGN